MPREFAPVNLDIWADPDFLDLPPAAQHLYLTLWTSPGLTYCGVHDWRPGRLAARSRGWNAEHIQTIADCLIARHFLVIDPETEEVLVRSWARFDGLLKQPRMAVSYVTAYATVASATLRAVLVYETEKYRKEHAALACWSDERVSGILDHPSHSAKDLPTPSDPFGDWVGDGFGLGLPQTPPKVWAKVSVPPTPSPAPAPYSSTPKRGTRKRATALSDDFEPNDTNQRLADERGLNLTAVVAQWRDHHNAKGSTMVDWHAALNTWIRREKPAQSAPTSRRLPTADELEQPPDGLTDEEYAAWDLERRERRRQA